MESFGSHESLASLSQGLRTGEIGLHEYLDELEGRFEEREPEILSFIPEESRFERLHKAADTLLEEHPSPNSRPPLFGVPVGVKDIFHVDGFLTRAGVDAVSDSLQGPEAESVSQLKEAGALILGKTVTTEFAYFAPGPTRNPHNHQHTPGGSSSGSAAAVAAGLTTLALGSQTIGSITRPAAFCGVLGYKPTYDRISRAGVIPLAPSVDHVGFMTTDVVSTQLAASLLASNWRTDARGSHPVLGVPEGPYLGDVEPEGIRHFRRVLEILEAGGIAVRPVPALKDFHEICDRHNLIVAGEAARAHEQWFDEFEARYHPKTLELLRAGQQITDERLIEALDSRLTLRERLTQLMDEHGLDLWITPSAPGAAPRGLESTGNPVMNLPWTHSGLPTVGLPAGRNGAGLPLAVQLAGRWHRDEEMLAQAVFVEAALSETRGDAIIDETGVQE